jgi:hypothetical protein
VDSDLLKPKQQQPSTSILSPRSSLCETFLRNSRRSPTNLGGGWGAPAPAFKLQYPFAPQFQRVA